jgi:hypothetical protein
MAAAAVPPRPSLRVPRPDAGASTRPTARRPPAKSEPRVSLHSVDLEEVGSWKAEAKSETHQRTTLLHPLGDEDPLDIVMASLRNVKCVRAVEAACVCLAVTVQAVGCRAAIAHLWDPREEAFVVAYALGPNAGVLLSAHHTKDDPLLAESFGKRVPSVVNNEQRPPLPRHTILGGAWSVLVAPVMNGDAPLGAIELIDPLDGSCFDDRHIAATRYATERLVALLGDADATIGKLIAPPSE